MSPRNTQFSREEIIDAAFKLVREQGWAGFSVQAVGKAINSSTMPIYSQFANVRELEDAVCLKAMELLKERMLVERTGDRWIDQGISYIRFAQEEKFLFRALWDGRNIELSQKMGKDLNEFISATLVDYPLFSGLDDLPDAADIRRYHRDTGGEAFLPESINDLVPICKRIAHDVRSQYTLGYIPTNRKRDGTYRVIRVKASAPEHRHLSIRTRTGYFAPALPSPPAKASDHENQN